MNEKKLISPEYKVTIGSFVLSKGISVECFSSKETHADWCSIELVSQFDGIIEYDDMDEAIVELGYDDDYDTLLSGYVRKSSDDYWKEIMIKDDIIYLDRTTIKATFIDCNPQDVIRYILTQAGIKNYRLSNQDYGKKKVFSIDKKTGIKAIADVNSCFGIENNYYFRDHVFYWGTKEEQEYIYELSENNNILSLNKYGKSWEIETIGVPWIHHSQEINVIHSKYSGIVEVEKTIVKTDNNGFTRMYIYFKGA